MISGSSQRSYICIPLQTTIVGPPTLPQLHLYLRRVQAGVNPIWYLHSLSSGPELSCISTCWYETVLRKWGKPKWVHMFCAPSQFLFLHQTEKLKGKTRENEDLRRRKEPKCQDKISEVVVMETSRLGTILLIYKPY